MILTTALRLLVWMLTNLQLSQTAKCENPKPSESTLFETANEDNAVYVAEAVKQIAELGTEQYANAD